MVFVVFLLENDHGSRFGSCVLGLVVFLVEDVFDFFGHGFADDAAEDRLFFWMEEILMERCAKYSVKRFENVLFKMLIHNKCTLAASRVFNVADSLACFFSASSFESCALILEKNKT